MATLSGNKIKDTYQSLVKFSDNGNITTSAKQLTDGFGNNSPMFVSTTQVGIGVTPEAGLNLHVFGDAKIGSNLTVIGNLVVEGSTTTVGTDTLTVKDPLIVLANNNTSTDAVDIGFYGKYTPSGTTLYSGLFREALTGKYRLFKGLEDEPTTTVNTSGTGYAVATLIGDLEGTLTGVIASTTTATTQSANDNSTKVATTAYVDNQVGLYDTLSEVLANGNTTGGTDIAITAGDDIVFGSTSKAIWSNALEIYRDGNDAYLKGLNGSLSLINNDNGTEKTVIKVNSNTAELYNNNVKKLETTNTGISVTGVISDLTDPSAAQDAATKNYVDTQIGANNELSEVLANGNTTGGTDIAVSANDDITFADNSKIILGAGSDLEIYSDGTDNYITQSSGTDLIFTIESSEMIRIQSGGDISISESNPGNASRFYVNGFGYSTAAWAVGTSTGTFVGQITSSGNKLQIKSEENNDIQIGDATSLNIIHIDTSEDSVGINLTNPSDYTADELVISVPDDSGMTLVSGTTDTAYITFADGTAAADQANFISHDHNTNTLTVFSQAKVSIGILEAEVAYFTDTAFYVDKSTTIDDTLTVNGNSTFAGTVLIDGVSSYTGLEVKGVGGSRPEIKWSNANNGNLGNIFGTETNDLVIATGSSGTTALTLDSSQNATFAGSVQVGSTAGYTTISQGAFFTKGGGDMFTANLLAGAAVSPMFKLQRNDVEKYNIGLDGNDNLAFINASGDVKMSIDSSGNLLLGAGTGNPYLSFLSAGGNGGNERARIFGYADGGTYGGGLEIQTRDSSNIFQNRINIDSSGNVGIGETGTRNARLLLNNAGSQGAPQLMLVDSGDSGKQSEIRFDSGNLIFDYWGGTSRSERMRISSDGDLLVGSTSLGLSNNGFHVYRANSSSTYAEFVRTTTTDASANIYISRANDGNVLTFYRNDVPATVGSVSVTTSATSYNTSSDYRLKENVVEMTGALDRVSQLKPSRFNFIADADKTVDGFLAHEVQDIVPEAITGEKDATYQHLVSEAVEAQDAVEWTDKPTLDNTKAEIQEWLDENNIEWQSADTKQELLDRIPEYQQEAVEAQDAVYETRPEYQGIDQSKLVPLLVGAIQELKAEIESLKQQINN